MQAFFMNATFLSSAAASAANTVATPNNGQVNGQNAGVFQALLAGQTPQQTTGNTTTGHQAPAENTLARIVLPNAGGDQKLLQPSVSRELAQLNPALSGAVEDLDTVFGQLRSLISQLRDALPAAPGATAETVGGSTVLNPTNSAREATLDGAPVTATSERLDVQGMLAAAAGKTPSEAMPSTPSPVTAPSPESDPLRDMLEPLRQQLAALGIDIDTLAEQASATGTNTETGLVAKAPVQDQINTFATGKITAPVQDVLATTPTDPEDIAATPVNVLGKTWLSEPHRPDASPTQHDTLMHRIAAGLDGLKQQLAEAGLPDTVIQGLESTINTVTVLAERPLPAAMVIELAQSPTPSLSPTLNGPAQSPSPTVAGTMAAQPAAVPPQTVPAPAPASVAAPVAEQAPAINTAPAPEAEAATPARAQSAQSAATSTDARQQLVPEAAATSHKPAGAAKPAVPSVEAKAPAFATPPIPAAAANPAMAADLAPVAPAPSVANAAATGQALVDPAPELSVVAAAQSARPTSAPGAQLAERNAKPANTGKGIIGPTSAKPVQASTPTQSTQAATTAGATPSVDTTPPDFRPTAPMPGQPSFDQPLFQSQPSTDTSLSFRPEQDLSLQRADGRMTAERATSEGQRFTPQSAQQLAAQITRRFANGSRVFDIRLDPAELGRVDVRLELSQDQRVQAILSAERPETLAELQRNARELERALNEAGLELEKDGLEFQLNENADDPGYNADEDPDVMPVFAESDDLDMAALANETAIERDAYGFRLAAARDRLDVRI